MSSSRTVRLVPLGGLGEIGMNCMAIEQDDGIFLIDCGTAFPADDLGIDVFHPDFRWVLERADRVKGVVITHGHEDHIGALPYLLGELDVPVWGPPHALGLIRRRLAEHDFAKHEVDLREVGAGACFSVGPFDVETVRVSHSIVEATALAIRTAAGTLLHTGDFNMDPDPPDGEPTDVARLKALGDEGVALLLSDSTNVDVPARPGSEREVGAALERIVRQAPARVFVVMFSSNVQRLKLLGEIAQRSRRKLCLLGRSLGTHRDVATAVGRLQWPSDLLIAPEQARDWPREALIVLAGGSQAERNSAMARLASGVHPMLEIEPGDTVAFSSRIIPGNERAVYMMMSDLLRRGARLHTRISDPDVHTSGHAGRSEQRQMIELTRPSSFLPVHGTLHHLMKHAELAKELGVRDVMVVESGMRASFDREQGLLSAGTIPTGRVAIALGGTPIEPDSLRRRSELARAGLCTVSVVLDDEGFIVAGPNVTTRGVPRVDDDIGALASIASEVAATLERIRTWRGVDEVEEARRSARRRLGELSGCRPMIEVHLLRAED
jgi:ribonuclease J